MDYLTNTPTGLLQGCCREAERAVIISERVDGLRNSLAVDHHAWMDSVSRGVRKSGLLLRDLADRSEIYGARVPYILNHLQVVLPCLCKTLQDINKYYENTGLSKERRWRTMFHKMADEAGGLQLQGRFALYNDFLKALINLLEGSPYTDFNLIETLKLRIMSLREIRGIAAPPMPVGPIAAYDGRVIPFAHEADQHWAERIFTVPTPSRTMLPAQGRSEARGPHFALGQGGIPPGSKVLFHKSFDSDKISITAYRNAVDQNPFLLSRLIRGGDMLLSKHGVHELCIEREASSLLLYRWSWNSQHSKIWAALRFQTWEDLVLFHCSFMALKAHNTLTTAIDDTEYNIHREKRLFQAQITDDKFKHSLIVYQDKDTGAQRLHAAVWEGELRQCPVWTAFLTPLQAQRRDWLYKKSRFQVRLHHDIQIFAFNSRYHQRNMRHRRTGDFMIEFVMEAGATKFCDLFYPRRRREGSADSAAGPSTPRPRSNTPRPRTPRPRTPGR